VGVLVGLGFPPPMEGFGFGSYSKTWTPTLGIHLYNEGPREGAGHPKTISWPPPIEWPATPSQTLAKLLHSILPALLSEAPPDFYTATDTTPSCCRIQEELLLPLPAGTGRWTSSSSTTERVTEYGGAARSWRRNRS
jgi:hypothetical protein